MDFARATEYFTNLQSRIVARLEQIDGGKFRRDEWQRAEGGGGISRLIEDGDVLERGGVNFSHVMGAALPASATAARPQLAGCAFEVTGGVVVGILVWQEGGESVAALLAVGLVGLVGLGYWLVRRKRADKPALIDPDLFKSPLYRLGITGQTMQQIALGGMMIALPLYLQMVLEYNALEAGVSLAPLSSLSMFAVALLAGNKRGNRRPGAIIRAGFGLLAIGVAVLIPLVPRVDTGWWLSVPCLSPDPTRAARLAAQRLHAFPDLGGEGGGRPASTRRAARSACLSAWPRSRRSCSRRVCSFAGWRTRHACCRRPSGGQVSERYDLDAEIMSDTALGAARGATAGDPGRVVADRHPRQARRPSGRAGGPAAGCPRRPVGASSR